MAEEVKARQIALRTRSFLAAHKAFVVNLLRIILALVLVFSGFVKAVDPMGTQYKLADYQTASGLGQILNTTMLMAMSVGLATIEFVTGIFLLFAIQRKLASRTAVLLLAVMTPLTLWLALTNKVSDCGCFGDAIVLTNWQTFWKNVVLLTAAIVVAWKPKAMFRFVSESNQWIVINFSLIFILAVSAIALYDQPILDFRPYHVGANIREGMTIPEGAEMPQFETTFIMEKDGKRQQFTLEDYPDTTWTFVEQVTKQTSQGYVPPVHDFYMIDESGEDIAEAVLEQNGYVFLLVSPDIEKADDGRLDVINELYEYCQENDIPFYGLTASGSRGIEIWREITGADYPILSGDETTLKTMVRSNPGLMLLKDGTVIGKWSSNRMPDPSEMDTSKPLSELPMGQINIESTTATAVKMTVWFVVPLTLLVIADRLWMWTRWIRRKKKE